MALRCLLFTSDEETADPIRQVLAGLGVEVEYCSEGAAAVEQATHKNFQIVIIDWDKQPEAGMLLTTARERKAAERPLTLAIVSDDLSVPKALQAGANSILRRPILVSQVNDTLTTARDLLRAKKESAAAAAAGVSVSSAKPPASTIKTEEAPPRAAEFLESSPPPAQRQFVTKSHAPEFVSAVEPVAPPKASQPIPPVAEDPASQAASPAPASPPPPGGPRGLEWYLKTRLGTAPVTSELPPAAPAARPKPELLGFDQMRSQPSEPVPPKPVEAAREIVPERPKQQGNQDPESEAELFAYMEGETAAPKEVRQPRARLGKGAIIGALALAACAIVAAPQAPWHSNMKEMWARGQHVTHGWFYPQPVTPVQAPVSHEDFGRAGDEYKMPVGETIPDATTDPSQIQVVPVVDPTAKKPNTDATNPQPPTGQPDPGSTTPADPTTAPAPGAQVQEKPISSSPSETPRSESVPSSGTTAPPISVAPPRSDSASTALPTASPVTPAPTHLAPPRNHPPRAASMPGNVPSSLKSQLASMTPDASGNKAPEAALLSIEPVVLTEATERALLTEQPALVYPDNAKGQQGTVILQVLIGRDGTVQDVKFLQGSLAFARAAIDGVKTWKFKPFTMNGRPVSVQTLMTIVFKPTV